MLLVGVRRKADATGRARALGGVQADDLPELVGQRQGPRIPDLDVVPKHALDARAELAFQTQRDRPRLRDPPFAHPAPKTLRRDPELLGHRRLRGPSVAESRLMRRRRAAAIEPLTAPKA